MNLEMFNVFLRSRMMDAELVCNCSTIRYGLLTNVGRKTSVSLRRTIGSFENLQPHYPTSCISATIFFGTEISKKKFNKPSLAGSKIYNFTNQQVAQVFASNRCVASFLPFIYFALCKYHLISSER